GFAVLLGLSEYFAKRQDKLDHTLVFLASAGHHGPNGPLAFAKAHPEIAAKIRLGVNLEHLAGVAVGSNIRSVPTGRGFPPLIKTTVENPKMVGVSNLSPYLIEQMSRASKEYGVVTL